MNSVKDYFSQPVRCGMHFMGWHGYAGHFDPRAKYTSDDPATIARQLDEIADWGFDFLMMPWFGDQDRPTTRTMGLLLDAAGERRMQVGISIDVGAITKRIVTSNNSNLELDQLIRFAESLFINHPAYLLGSDGRPLVFEFGMETLPTFKLDPIDWPAIIKKYPFSFIHRNIGGFATPGAGSYAWLDNGLPYLNDYYKRANVPSQTSMCFGSLFKGFDNRKVDASGLIISPEVSTWTGKPADVKIIPENNGQTFLDTVTATNAFVATGGKLAGIIFNTYNDWQEGTACEGGLNHNVTILPAGNQNCVQNVDVTMKPMFKKL